MLVFSLRNKLTLSFDFFKVFIFREFEFMDCLCRELCSLPWYESMFCCNETVHELYVV